MRKVMCLFFVLFVSTIYAQDKALDWHYDYDMMLKKAKKNKKPILVYFSGSDWCSPCIALSRDLFSAIEYQQMFKDYNLLYVDIPQNRDLISEQQYKHNKEILELFNTQKSFPTIVVLTRKGKEKKRMAGYNGKDQLPYYLNFLK